MLSIEVVAISIHLFIKSIFVFIIILYKKKFELQLWNCKLFKYKMIVGLMSEVIASFVNVEATTSSMGGKWL
jgi:hypothetical protein